MSNLDNFETELTQLLEKYAKANLKEGSVPLSIGTQLSVAKSMLIVAQNTIEELKGRLALGSPEKLLKLTKELEELELEAEVSEDPAFTRTYRTRVASLKLAINDIARNLT